MLFLEYSNYNQSTINDNFGAPEYSYWFVRKAFRHILERIGTRVEVKDPKREVDDIFRSARERGEPCVFLPFCPPNTTPLDQACPTIPVFAWEYDTLPDEVWNNNPTEDWTHVLRKTGMAMTHCQSAAESVRRSMGDAFPTWVIPAPLFDKYKLAKLDAQGWREPFDLVLEGGLAVSAGDVDLTWFRPERPPADGIDVLRLLDRNHIHRNKPQVLTLEGVIYTSILNPYDGRKNWRDMVSGFVWAFRETPTATLLLKLTRFDVEDGLLPVLQLISTLGPFSCRIVLIHGMLSESAYRGLIDCTSYTVNTSYGEGQCLPLMEYMSAGRPAVAPAHTAMRDYVTQENSFVIDSEARLTHWPHDERTAKRCMHYRVSFADLVHKFRQSYRVARDQPERYERLAASAVDSLRAFCSDEVAIARFDDVIKHVEALQRTTHDA
ncbi:MAG: hypothetical protein Q8R82_19755 [Hyphomonadaceae bacterium]|nr:hypothetical protein [Hyphomonadaceae bacterium]